MINIKKCLALVASILILSVSFLAHSKQVVNQVHVGGPDMCSSIGEKPGCDANFSLHALAFLNGKVTGQYTDRFAGGDGFHAKIDCLVVIENEAWVSGTIKKGKEGDGDLAGLSVVTKVIDNGKNQEAPFDQISFSYIGLDISCEDATDLGFPMMDAQQGQVSIR